MSEAKRQKERLRLLRLLAERSYTLEWPCENAVLRELVDNGEIALGESSTARWNRREHAMRRLSITPAGRAVIASNQDPGQ